MLGSSRFLEEMLVPNERMLPIMRKRERGLRACRIEVQLRDVAAYPANILGVCWVPKRIVIDLDFRLTLFNLLGIPQL